MSLVIRNETDGEIPVQLLETGQYLRLGKYVFLCGSFSRLLKDIADYPDLRQGNMMGIGFDSYWYENNDNVLTGGFQVPVRISDDERVVSIGDYHIDTPDFNQLAAYVIKSVYAGFEEDCSIKIPLLI